MRALIVNAGNTHTSCVAWEAGSEPPSLDAAGVLRPTRPLHALARLATPRTAAAETRFAREFGALLAGSKPPAVVLVSVVPRATGLVLAARPDALVADHGCPLPFRHTLDDPAATGADRICNVAAAAAAGLASALVVDAGTATTCDVLRAGVHLGGVIAPGMAFAAAQIGRRAARLRVVPFRRVDLRAGRNTSDALAAGGFHAGVGGVEHLIAGLLAAHGDMPVVLTGGLAAHLAAPGRHIDPDWTLRGAACLAGLNA